MYFTHFTHLPISHAHAHPHQCVPREILMHFDVFNMLIRTTSTFLRLNLYFDPKSVMCHSNWWYTAPPPGKGGDITFDESDIPALARRGVGIPPI